jgi:hypothetical protein
LERAVGVPRRPRPRPRGADPAGWSELGAPRLRSLSNGMGASRGGRKGNNAPTYSWDPPGSVTRKKGRWEVGRRLNGEVGRGVSKPIEKTKGLW